MANHKERIIAKLDELANLNKGASNFLTDDAINIGIMKMQEILSDDDYTSFIALTQSEDPDPTVVYYIYTEDEQSVYRWETAEFCFIMHRLVKTLKGIQDGVVTLDKTSYGTGDLTISDIDQILALGKDWEQEGYSLVGGNMQVEVTT